MLKLSVGTAESHIKLVAGYAMTGYLGRASGAEGIHDPLKIRCVALSNDEVVTVIVVCDLLGLSGDFIAGVSRSAAAVTSIPEENILVACTHTHSGPASIFLRCAGDVKPKWMEDLKADIVTCIQAALDGMEPCYLKQHLGTSDINVNRDTVDRTEAEALRDNQLMLLSIYSSRQDTLKALLVNYACHPTVLLDNNLLYSADYPFYLEQALKKRLGQDTLIVFANGCCGNLGPVSCGSFQAAAVLGETLASDAAAAMEAGDTLPLLNRTDMEMKTVNIEIPLNHNLDLQQLEKYKEEYDGYLKDELNKNGMSLMAKIYIAFIDWAEDMEARLQAGKLEKLIYAGVKVLRLGPVNIVGLPFEGFHDVGLKIKELFGKNTTMVISYANGDFGYLPSRELYRHGYYETWDSFKYYGQPGPVSEDSEDILLEALKKSNKG